MPLEQSYPVPVYTELTGADGAFKALEGTFYTSDTENPASYSVSNGVQIKMLVPDYVLTEPLVLSNEIHGTVTLTTAASNEAVFPYQGMNGASAVIRRGYGGDPLFTLGGEMSLTGITLDGRKNSYAAKTNGGLIHVKDGGKLTVKDRAALLNSKTRQNGGAVYVDSGGVMTMSGGVVNQNGSDGQGAGIYLEEGSTLYLSGNPGFGGTGLDVGGNISDKNENWQSASLVGKTNGGKYYERARQDIYIAGYAGGNGATNASSELCLMEPITSMRQPYRTAFSRTVQRAGGIH